MSRNAISANPEHYIFKIFPRSMLPGHPRRPKKNCAVMSSTIMHYNIEVLDFRPARNKLIDLNMIISKLFLRI